MRTQISNILELRSLLTKEFHSLMILGTEPEVIVSLESLQDLVIKLTEDYAIYQASKEQVANLSQ